MEEAVEGAVNVFHVGRTALAQPAPKIKLVTGISLAKSASFLESVMETVNPLRSSSVNFVEEFPHFQNISAISVTFAVLNLLPRFRVKFSFPSPQLANMSRMLLQLEVSKLQPLRSSVKVSQFCPQ